MSLHPLRTFRRRAADDAGLALPAVVMVSVVLFVLVMMLITLVEYQETQSARQAGRVRAMHMADAGVNAYLYELRRNPTFWVTQPSLGPTSMTEGSWLVTATAPTQDKPLTLRSVGTLAGNVATRTVVATVRFPTFADYMFAADTDINVGADATIYGKLRSNGNINNDGRITGRAYATGRVSGPGTFEAGYDQYYERLDFAQVTADLASIRTQATASGTYYGPSGAQGYRVTINGASIQVAKVTGGTSSGNLTTTPLGSVSVPASGVLYFNDRVWVSGTYSAKTTIASSSDIYIPDNLQASNPSGSATLGLVAQNNIIVPSWYPNLPQPMTVSAAMLAQTGSIYGDLQSGITKSGITINGSMAYKGYSYFAQYSGSTVTAGFRSRSYRYDSRLDVEPPPMYPQIRDGSLKVSTWIEH